VRIIAGKHRGRTIKTGRGPGYRPATGKVREAVFSILDSLGVSWPGVNVLDLFAGSGSLGLEALSRGAAGVVFVEQDPGAARILRENIQNLGISMDRADVVQQNVFIFLKKSARPFELVFVDPPYGQDMLEAVLPLVLNRKWLRKSGFLCVEVEGGLSVDADRYNELSLLKDRNFGQTRILLWIRKS